MFHRMDINLPALHHFVARRAFYPLLMCTVIALGFVAVRFHFSGTSMYRFLVWNLFLAWLPYWCSVMAAYWKQNLKRRRWLVWFAGAGWLILLPNAPYIMTDVIHVINNPTRQWWYDVGMVLSFALTGCFLGVVSLQIMHNLVRRRVGEIAGWVFVMICAGLSGFGVYLGRFERLNSWDVLLRPQRVLSEVGMRMIDPLSHPRTAGVTLMFGALMLICYVMFTTAGAQTAAAEAK